MDTKRYRKASIWCGNRKCGYLSENIDGYSFIYDKEYLKSEDPVSISLTLPLREDEYKSKTLFPFFDGLILEGWLLEKALENSSLSYKDRFGLLLSLCKDCIGDISIKEEEGEEESL